MSDVVTYYIVNEDGNAISPILRAHKDAMKVLYKLNLRTVHPDADYIEEIRVNDTPLITEENIKAAVGKYLEDNKVKMVKQKEAALKKKKAQLEKLKKELEEAGEL